MTPPSPTLAPRVADRTLFTSLVDDAAVFPPGNAPLEEAVRWHRFHRVAAYSWMVGPLLVPVSSASQLQAVAQDSASALTPELSVALVARRGVATTDVEAAVAELGAAAGVTAVAVEMGWEPQWRRAELGGLPLTLEVDRGEPQLAALDDLRDATDLATPVQAKFRTGATSTWVWPDEVELARFLHAAVEAKVAFKLTGGLHHLVRGTRGGGEQHGLLNVLLAVHLAIAGADPETLATVLGERDTDRLVERTGGIGPDDAAAVRRTFTAYGCCEVTDPIGELTTRRLIEGA
jgi:hypothetical protein